MDDNLYMQYTYLIYDGEYYKIGKSNDPEKRIKTLLTANPKCKLICYGKGVSEKDLHTFFFNKRVWKRREWFFLNEKDVQKCTELINQEMSMFKPTFSDSNTIATIIITFIFSLVCWVCCEFFMSWLCYFLDYINKM